MNIEDEILKLPNDWVSKSDYSSVALAKWFDNHLNRLGIHTDLAELIEDEDYQINFFGNSIFFNHKGYGCQIDVHVRNRKTAALSLFWLLWKSKVNDHVIWDGPYKKELVETAQPAEEITFADKVKSTRDEEKLEIFAFLWVERLYKKDGFEKWKAANDDVIGDWFTRTMLYDQLKKMFAAGKIIKSGSMYAPKPKKISKN